MIYTPEEKKHLDAVLTSFRDYIDQNPYFDILYSEKCGYLYLSVEEDLMPPTRMSSAEVLIETLLHEISHDVRDLFLCGEHFGVFLHPAEVEVCKFRAKRYIDQLPAEFLRHGRAATEIFFAHCNDNAC